jgi:hypothetical protein
MPELNVVHVDPGGVEVDVDITRAGGASVTAYTTSAGTAPRSLPATISAVTDFWLPEAGDFTFIVSKDDVEVKRETIGVSDREDQPKTLRLTAGDLPLSALASLVGGATGTSVALGQVVAKTADYTAVNGDYVTGDATGGTFSVTLPAASVGARVTVQKTDATTGIVSVKLPDTSVLADLALQGEANTFVSVDGATWVRQFPFLNAAGPFALATQVATSIDASGSVRDSLFSVKNQLSSISGNDLVIVSAGGAADIAIRRRSGGTGVLFIDIPVKLSSGSNFTIQDHSNVVRLTVAEATGHVTLTASLFMSTGQAINLASSSIGHSSNQLNISGGSTSIRFLNNAFDAVNATISDLGNFSIGRGAPAAGATDGFPYIPVTAGSPSGTPTTVAGFVPMRYDSTNHKLWVYDSGWKGVVLA